MRKIYPSDITREQFSKLEPLLESARKKTKPRSVDLYDVFCAVCSERWYPVAYAARGFPKMENSLQLLATME